MADADELNESINVIKRISCGECAICDGDIESRYEYRLTLNHCAAIVLSLGYIPHELESNNIRICRNCQTMFTKGKGCTFLEACAGLILESPTQVDGHSNSLKDWKIKKIVLT